MPEDDLTEPALSPALASAAELVELQTMTANMIAEAQMVVTMRLLGMVGLWDTGAEETERMVSEKQQAFSTAAEAALRAVAAGKRADEIASAAVRPIRRRTRANVARLAKLGPQTSADGN